MSAERSEIPAILNYAGWIKGEPVPPRRAFSVHGFDRWSIPYSCSSFRGARQEAIQLFGFAIPCKEAIDALLKFGPWLEIGAGTGYWSAILAANGADVIATDACVGGKHHGYGFKIGHHFNVQKMTGMTAVRAHPDRAVLAVWPTLDDEWCAEAAKQIPLGGILALVHEGESGAIAEQSLFDLLEDKFSSVAAVDLPNWPGINDRLEIFRRSRS